MSEIVIVGGGIIGCCVAQQISHSSPNPPKITLLEASPNGIAQGASGKAGGLIAKWAYPKALVDLSFREHEKLAAAYDGEKTYGWRYVNTGSWSGRGSTVTPSTENKGKSLEKEYGLQPDRTRKAAKQRKNGDALPKDLDWLDESQTEAYSPMAALKDSAQVHPYLFTQKMWELAQSKGAQLITGAKVTGIMKNDQGKVCGVEYTHGKETKQLQCDKLILTAGAWSPTIIPKLPVTTTRAHSVVIKAEVSPYVVFTEITSADGRSKSSPEIYARPDNTAYACGEGDDSRLPETVDDVQVDDKACQLIIDHVNSVSENLRTGEVVARQACFLPLGGPIIGEMSKVAKNLFVATGHTCWGICNAPGTAKAIAELVLEGQIKSADLSRLDPKHFQ